MISPAKVSFRISGDLCEVDRRRAEHGLVCDVGSKRWEDEETCDTEVGKRCGNGSGKGNTLAVDVVVRIDS